MHKYSPADGLARLPGPPNALWPDGARSVALLEHGTMQLELYAPPGRDPQQPHTRDEVYVVATGRAVFECEAAGGVPETEPVRAGDALFVPAGRRHRFTDLSGDFATWVVFYGPEGGDPA
jgi:mannose-6-phosphate isomerase-like protein (cupin superfamily)